MYRKAIFEALQVTDPALPARLSVSLPHDADHLRFSFPLLLHTFLSPSFRFQVNLVFLETKQIAQRMFLSHTHTKPYMWSRCRETEQVETF